MSELTIDQMSQIVDNAPDWAKAYNTKMKQYTNGFIRCSSDVFLSDLKAQIDQHYYGQSEEKELEQYAILSQEKIEGGAVLIGGSSIQKKNDQLKTENEHLAEINQRYIGKMQEQQDMIAELKAEKTGLEERIDEITHLATKLAEYASYAEIVGAVTHNRSAVRKYCDEIFDFNRKVDDELEEALRGGHE